MPDFISACIAGRVPEVVAVMRKAGDFAIDCLVIFGSL
jgi:hypothetical protein